MSHPYVPYENKPSGSSVGFCYIPVDFATAASQNGFIIHKLSLHNKNNVIKKSNVVIFCISLIIYY
jgi:hypothetical protein